MTRAQAAILIALLAGELITFGALLGPDSWDGIASSRPAAAGTARPSGPLFAPYYPVGGATTPATGGEGWLVEEAPAPGDAAR